MAPKAAEPAAPALPSTTDFNALYNRISLAAAKQNTFLTSMRAKYPSLKKTTPAPTQTTEPSQTSGFSSLRPEPSSPAPSYAPTKTKAQLRAEQEDAADPLRYDAPNAGLGFIPSKAEAHADAATQDLSRRILGKRAREIKARAAGGGAKRRAEVDEESDEDEGRSGLGRRKRTRAVPKEEDKNEDAVVTESPAEAVPMPEEEAAPESIPETAAPIEAPTADPSDGKKKKKKNKKKKQVQG